MKSEKTETFDSIMDSLKGSVYDVYKAVAHFQKDSVPPEEGDELRMSNGKMKLFCYDKSGKVQAVKNITVEFFNKSDYSIVKDDERPSSDSVIYGYFISPDGS